MTARVRALPLGEMAAEPDPRMLSEAEDTASAALYQDHPLNHPEFDGGFSCWFVPSCQAELDDEVQRMRSSWGGAPFWHAHCTAHSPIYFGAADDPQAWLERVASGLKAFPVTVKRVEAGQFYHQDVYLLLESSAELLDARSAVYCASVALQGREPADATETVRGYKPHISLAYGGHGLETRAAMVEDLATRVDVGKTLTISRMEVWKCFGRTSEWTRAAAVVLDE
jgi:hypothetical protein